jgi:outer membrane protein TolC
LQQLQLLLHQIMEQAYSSMPAAKGRIAVLKDQVNACEESFFINSVQFENKSSNSTAYLKSKNNLDHVRINLATVNYLVKILPESNSQLQMAMLVPIVHCELSCKDNA